MGDFVFSEFFYVFLGFWGSVAGTQGHKFGHDFVAVSHGASCRMLWQPYHCMP